MSSTFLGGELVNGVFSESSNVDFQIATLGGISGTVVITVVQQEFGVTITVSLCRAGFITSMFSYHMSVLVHGLSHLRIVSPYRLQQPYLLLVFHCQ